MIETATLHIGYLAKSAEVNIQTIRYYERRGLLPEPERSVSNYRVYSKDTVRQIRFIKRAQELGFTLNEIKDLLELCASSHSCCQDVQAKSKAKIDSIADKIRSLMAMQARLTELMSECSGSGPIADCSIIGSLQGED